MKTIMDSRRLAAGAIALGLLVGGIVTRPPAARAEDPARIRIENFSFVPTDLTVKAGTKVIWENTDDIPHSVVLADKSFRSKPLDTLDEATFTFVKTGTVEYFCGLHPFMHARITVIP